MFKSVSKKIIRCVLLVSLFAIVTASASFAAPAPNPQNNRIAFVDFAAVNANSVPGKDGKQYLTALAAELNKEVADYKASLDKDKKANEKTAAKQAEVRHYYGLEQLRVSQLILNQTKTAVNEWLRINPSYAAVSTTAQILGLRPDLDITAEIVKRMEKLKVDFAAGRIKRQQPQPKK